MRVSQTKWEGGQTEEMACAKAQKQSKPGWFGGLQRRAEWLKW